MHHEFALIATLAWGLGLALVLGFAATKVKLPALVGYLLAGVCIAPTTPGFVGDMDLAAELSEVGVMLLMFGVGLHFSLTDLLRVKTVALPGAIIQMAIATAIGMGMAHWWGWSWGEAFILGLSLSCASTVALMKGLEAKGWLQRSRGQLAVGWLVVEDLVTVLLLVLLPSIATFFKGDAPGDGSLTVAILETTVLIIGFIASMLVIGRRVLPWVLFQAVKTGSQEVFTLCVIAIAIGVAYASAQIFNVSFALGAFFAGMMMRESEYSHRAALQTLPLQDAFSVIFFLGVGMLFNPMIIIDNPLHVLGIVLVIIVCKSITAAVWVKVMGRSYKDALTVGAALAQVGEFSFILAGLGLNLGLLPEEGMSLILAGGIISIALNPLLFALVEPVHKRFFLKENPAVEEDEEDIEEEKAAKRDRVIIIGAGVLGRELAEGLMAKKIDVVIIEKNIERSMKEELGDHFILGDAMQKQTLEFAGIERARWVVVSTTDPVIARKVVDVVGETDPEVRVVAIADKTGEEKLFLDTNGELPLHLEHLLQLRHEAAKTILSYVCGPRGLRAVSKVKRSPDKDSKETKETKSAKVVKEPTQAEAQQG